MNIYEVLLQQVINGIALGMMYALLALGFTMVYGIIELINFAHFSVFQYKENKAFPLDDLDHQAPYIGVAPEVPQS